MNKNSHICSFFQDFVYYNQDLVRYNRDFVRYNQEGHCRNYLKPNQRRITVRYKREFVITEFVITEFDCNYFEWGSTA